MIFDELRLIYIYSRVCPLHQIAVSGERTRLGYIASHFDNRREATSLLSESIFKHLLLLKDKNLFPTSAFFLSFKSTSFEMGNK